MRIFGNGVHILKGRLSITVPTASAAAALTLSGLTGVNTLTVASTGAASSLGMGWSIGLFSSFYNIYTNSTDGLSLCTVGNAELRFSTNSVTRLQMMGDGRHIFAAPSTAVTTVAINGSATAWPLTINGGASTQAYARWQLSGSDVGFIGGAAGVVSGGASGDFAVSAQQSLILGSNISRVAVTIGTSGNITIIAPVSGVTTTTNIIAGGWNATWTDSTRTLAMQVAAGNGYFGTLTSDILNLVTAGVSRVTVATSNADAMKVVDDGGTLQTVGWRDMPQNAQTTGYTLALADRGKHLYYSGAGGVTVTIPANASVAFPIGSTVVVVNDTGGNLSVAITTDTLSWLQGGASSSGTRTVATRSVVTLVKVSSTVWIITGSGIS